MNTHTIQKYEVSQQFIKDLKLRYLSIKNVTDAQLSDEMDRLTNEHEEAIAPAPATRTPLFF